MIIQMNSNATAGVSRARPRTWVCCVAIAASCYLLKADVAAVTAPCLTAAKICDALFDIAGDLHFAFRGSVSSLQLRIDGRDARERSRELLADVCADTLQFL